MLTFAPNEAEANRTLLYNVTLRVGSASMRFLKDDVEVGSTILAMGRETRVELPAADKARYSYEFFAESVGAGSIHVGVANRGSVRPSDDAGPVRDRGVGWLLVPLG